MPDHTPRTLEIQLTQGKIGIIDVEDADLLVFNWHATENGLQVYARRILPKVAGKQRREYLHQAIMARKLGMSIPSGIEIDHIDGDALNNRRNNLRLASHTHNAMNQPVRDDSSTGVTGVSWVSRNRKWRAYITVGGKQIHLGSFDEFDVAVSARREAARKYFGDFARRG